MGMKGGGMFGGKAAPAFGGKAAAAEEAREGEGRMPVARRGKGRPINNTRVPRPRKTYR